MDRKRWTRIIVVVAILVAISVTVPVAYAFIADTINSGNNSSTKPMTVVVSDTYGDPSSLMEVSLPVPDKNKITSVTENGPWSFNDAYTKRITGYIYAQCPNDVGKMRVWIDMKDMRSWSVVERVTLNVYDDDLSRGSVIFRCSDTEEKTLVINLKVDAINTTYEISSDTLNNDPGYVITGLGTGSSVINAVFSKGTVSFQCSDNGENSIALKVKASRTNEDLILNAGSGYEITGVGASSTVSAATHYYDGDIKFKCGDENNKILKVRVKADNGMENTSLTLSAGTNYTFVGATSESSALTITGTAASQITFRCSNNEENIIALTLKANSGKGSTELTLSASTGYSIRGTATGSTVQTASYQEKGKMVFKCGDTDEKILAIRVKANLGQENKDLTLSAGANYTFNGVDSTSTTATIRSQTSSSITFRCNDSNEKIIAIKVTAGPGQGNTELQLLGGATYSITGVCTTSHVSHAIHILSHNAKVAHQYLLFGADSELLEVGGEPNRIELPVVIHPDGWDVAEKNWDGKRFDIDVTYRTEINTNPFILGDDLLVSKVNFVAAVDDPVPTLSVKYYIGYKDGTVKDYNVNNDLIVKTYAYQGNVINPPNAPKGYNITGWYLAKDENGQGTGTEWNFAENHLDPRDRYEGWHDTSELVLYAKSNVITYNVTFDWDELTLSGSEYPNRTYTVNSESFNYVSYTVPSEEKVPKSDTTGTYHLKGWTGTGLSGINTDISIPKGSVGDRTYTAVWTYDVEFNANGGTGSMDKQTITRGVISLLNKMNGLVAPTSKVFYGWNTAQNGSGISYEDGASVENLGDITLYAIWKYKRTITFNAGTEGTGTMSPQSVWDNVSTPLNANTFTKEGCMFYKWDMVSASGEGSISDGGNITVTNDTTLYAIWKTKRTITFNNNGGTGTMSQDVCDNVPTPMKKNTLTAPSGKIFDSWNTANDGSGTPYEDGAIITVTGNNTTLYAIWVDKATISFNSNGGSGVMLNQDCKKNVYTTLDANTFTKSGWTFFRWDTDQDGHGSIEDGASYKPTGNVILYAIWKCEVVYDKNDDNASGTMSPDVVYSYNAKDTVKANGYTAPTDLYFYGWNAKPDGKGTYYNPGDVLNITGGIKLYAIWGYKVVFDGNTGTGTMSDQVIPKDIATELNANTFTAPGNRAFYGWNTSAVNERLYADQQKIVIDTSKTPVVDHKIKLYAIWGCSVTFDLNVAPSGFDAPDTIVVKYNGTVSEPDMELDAYRVTWYKDSVIFKFDTDTNPDTVGENITLKAKWDLEIYLVYNPLNTDDQRDQSIWVPYGVAITSIQSAIESQIASEDRWSSYPSWWNTNNLGRGVYFRSNIAYTFAYPMAIYSIWHDPPAQNPPNPYMPETRYYIRYISNGGDGYMDAQGVPKGDAGSVTLKAIDNTKFYRDGWVFYKWNLKADGNGTSYDNGQTSVNIAAIGGNIALFAMWRHSVTYDGNGNTGGEVPTDVTLYEDGGSVTTKINSESLVKAGYTFAGWNTEPDGSGITYSVGATFSITKNANLYALWNATVTLEQNGGSSESSSLTVASNSDTFDMITAPIRDGYTFLGYYTASSGGIKVIDKGDLDNFVKTTATGYIEEGKWVATESKTLYAQWAENQVVVTFYPNGGTGTMDKQIITQSAGSKNLNGNTYTREGYTFSRWDTGPEGNVESIAGGADISGKITSNTSTLILHAIWTPISYAITLSTEGATTQNVDGATVIFNTGTLTYKLGDETKDFVAPAKDDYTFAGFFTNDGIKVIDLNGKLVYGVEGYTVKSGESGRWIKAEAITLYAHWTATVTLGLDGGSSSISKTIVTYNSSDLGYKTSENVAVTPFAAPTKTGYTFLGFFDGEIKVIDADGTLVESVSGYTNSGKKWIRTEGNAALTAKWSSAL